MKSFSFQVADYIVGLFVLLVPVVIGVVFAIRDKNRATREEYLLGGRDMHILPVALSMFITFQSAISLIGVPAEVYMYGSMYMWLAVGLSLSYVISVFTLIPVFYPLRLTSIYEYLLLRYRSKALRTMCTLSGMVTTICYMAIALFSPALALQHSAGIPLWMSVIIVGALGTIYTTIGGIKSVIWTDAFQTVIVFIGIFAMMAKGVLDVGGVQEVWDIASAGKRTSMDVTDLDPRARLSYMGCLIGGCLMWLTNCFNQSTLQRMGAMATIKKAKCSFLINVPTILIYYFLLIILGNIIFAYIANTRCDPYEAGYITNMNQMAPYFVLDAMDSLPGIPGLYVSTLCCGSLSTLSSGINALAANTVEDILAGPLRNLREGSVTLVTKICVFLYGSVIVGLAYAATSLQGPVTQISGSVFGAFGSPVLGIFIMGCCVPWANKYGAFAGVLVSLAVNLWYSIGSLLYGRKTHRYDPVPTDMCFSNSSHFSQTGTNFTSSGFQFPNSSTVSMTLGSNARDSNDVYDYGFFLYDVSYEWLSVMGLVVCMMVGFLVSYLTKSSTQNIDPALMFPFVRRFWGLEERPCKPEHVHMIKFNVESEQCCNNKEENGLKGHDS